MKLHITRHARSRMAEMGVARGDVKSVLLDPSVTYPGRHQSPPETIAQAGDIAVAYVEQDGVQKVLTVLWACQEYERAS